MNNKFKQETDKSMLADNVQLLESCIGYEFKNKALALESITHRSYHNEQSMNRDHNERLEFLGDAVLDLIISQTLMKMIPPWPEGKLTAFRAALVNEGNLAQTAEDLNIGPNILLGKGEEMNNGRKKPSILSDCVEAIVGAIFLDSDYNTCNEVVLPWFQSQLFEVTTENNVSDPKSDLQQQMQAKGFTPTYKLISTHGPDHDKTYEIQVCSGGEYYAIGTGKSKKEAEKQAAQNSLEMINNKETT